MRQLHTESISSAPDWDPCGRGHEFVSREVARDFISTGQLSSCGNLPPDGRVRSLEAGSSATRTARFHGFDARELSELVAKMSALPAAGLAEGDVEIFAEVALTGPWSSTARASWGSGTSPSAQSLGLSVPPCVPDGFDAVLARRLLPRASPSPSSLGFVNGRCAWAVRKCGQLLT